jgi:Tfp pilus assembly protein PilX
MMQPRTHNSMQYRAKQTGATLLVAMMFLLMMTLFAVSSINMSTINLKIISNMQASKALDATGRDVLEQLMNTPDTFVAAPTNTVTVTEYNPATSATVTTAVTVGGNATTALGTTVAISTPECVDSQTATGYSALYTGLSPDDNTWEIIVTIADPVTGATSTTHQGTQVRMLSDNCPI